MRSRPELSALLLCCLLGASAPVPAASQAPTQAEIDRAIKTVRADPNLATEKTVHRLAWEGSRDEPPASHWAERFSWIGDLFRWLGEISRMLMWLVIVALVAALTVLLVRVFRSGRAPRFAKSFVAPTHVQDLDIRPESLPADIGATARGLWDRGEQRAALALLYRGLLSRLAHVYEVPIRDSSTEGDCLSVAARTLESSRLEFATRLVSTWQRAIYGGLGIDAAVVHELCANFDVYLERPGESRRPQRAHFTRGAPA